MNALAKAATVCLPRALPHPHLVSLVGTPHCTARLALIIGASGRHARGSTLGWRQGGNRGQVSGSLGTGSQCWPEVCGNAQAVGATKAVGSIDARACARFGSCGARPQLHKVLRRKPFRNLQYSYSWPIAYVRQHGVLLKVAAGSGIRRCPERRRRRTSACPREW